MDTGWLWLRAHQRRSQGGWKEGEYTQQKGGTQENDCLSTMMIKQQRIQGGQIMHVTLPSVDIVRFFVGSVPLFVP